MPKNKNASLRYNILDKCFRNIGKQYFIEDLVEACNEQLKEFNGIESTVRNRQIYEDIKFMESEAGWSAPIDRIRYGKRKYYRYENTSFSINSFPLSEQEINELKTALLILNRFSGLPQIKFLNSLLPIIDSAVAPNEFKESVSFDSNPYLRGLEYLNDLLSHILNKNVLKIKYKEFHKEEEQIILHPHFLKEYNNRWYVFGYNPIQGHADWNLALDRMVTIEVLKERFVESKIDWQDYFEDIIGVTKLRGGDCQKIQLLLKPSLWPYVKTKPFHGSQKLLKEDEHGIIIELDVIPNFELIQQILFMGNQIEIISPKEVREQLLDILNNTISNYS